MRKLTLDLEELVVESFDTAEVQGTGTVHAHAPVTGSRC